MMHAPSERTEEDYRALLPEGAERPTILPLAGREQQRVAMRMVSSETLFWGNHGN